LQHAIGSTVSRILEVYFYESGHLRSLLPRNVNVMALTATAARPTLDCVVEKLSMNNPEVFSLPPSRGNIKYVVKPLVTLKEFVHSL